MSIYNNLYNLYVIDRHVQLSTTSSFANGRFPSSVYVKPIMKALLAKVASVFRRIHKN